MEEDVKQGLIARAWEDPLNTEIRFVPPGQIGVPNSTEALMSCLSDVAEQKRAVFSELGIANDVRMQIAFVIYHERRHKSHFEEGKLRPFMSREEIDEIERDADEFARQRIKKFPQKEKDVE